MGKHPEDLARWVLRRGGRISVVECTPEKEEMPPDWKKETGEEGKDNGE